MARVRRIEQWRFNKTPRTWQSSPTTSRTCSNRCKTGGLEGFISSQVDLLLPQVSDHVGPDHLQNRRHGDKDRRSRAQHQRPHGTGFHISQKHELSHHIHNLFDKRKHCRRVRAEALQPWKTKTRRTPSDPGSYNFYHPTSKPNKLFVSSKPSKLLLSSTSNLLSSELNQVLYYLQVSKPKRKLY